MYEEKSDFDFQVGNEFVLFNGKNGKLIYKYKGAFILNVEDSMHYYTVNNYNSRSLHKDYAIMGMIPSKPKNQND